LSSIEKGEIAYLSFSQQKEPNGLLGKLNCES
jgi:hypothetical protein